MIFLLQINFSPTNVLSVRFTYFSCSLGLMRFSYFYDFSWLIFCLHYDWIFIALSSSSLHFYSIDITLPSCKHNNSTAAVFTFCFSLDCFWGHHTEGSKMLKNLSLFFGGSKWLSKCSCRFLNCSIAACQNFFCYKHFNSRVIDFVHVVLLVITSWWLCKINLERVFENFTFSRWTLH